MPPNTTARRDGHLIEFQCKHCQTDIRIPNSSAGKRGIKCPQCAGVVNVPLDTAPQPKTGGVRPIPQGRTPQTRTEQDDQVVLEIDESENSKLKGWSNLHWIIGGVMLCLLLCSGLLAKTISYVKTSIERQARQEKKPEPPIEAAPEWLKVDAPQERIPHPVITEKKWYEGGTLHKRTALDWRQAAYENKLATCADMVISMRDKDHFSQKVKASMISVDDCRPYATELVAFIDRATVDAETKPSIANQKVSSFAVPGMVMMGWVKEQ